MDKGVLNEVKRNRELMGINESEIDEQGFIDALKRGVDKGKELAKKIFNKKSKEGDDGITNSETENTESPIKVEEYKQTTIKTYNDYITVEATTPGDREIAQKLINATASEKGLGQQTKRELLYLDDGGYKVIAYFDK